MRKNLEEAKQEIESIIKELKSTTCCFTGHRPQKLPWRFNEKDERCIEMKNKTKEKIEEAIKCGYNTFLCGMALGFDMMCAELVLELKKTYPHIKLIGALPCKNQDCKWIGIQRKRYKSLLQQLNGIRCIYDTYVGPECMLERNHYMISNSSLVIALFDGKPGGTAKTIEDAKKQGLKIEIVKP